MLGGRLELSVVTRDGRSHLTSGQRVDDGRTHTVDITVAEKDQVMQMQVGIAHSADITVMSHTYRSIRALT